MASKWEPTDDGSWMTTPVQESQSPDLIAIVKGTSVQHNTPQTCEELLQRMVGFNTINRVKEGVPFVERELAEYLERIAGEWGLQTRRLPIPDVGFNLLVCHEVDPSAPWLMFDSHLDTVGVESMTVEPFAGKIIDGRLYGRGACDTKGTGAAMLWGLRQVASQGIATTNTALLFSIEEEAAKTGARALVDSQLDQLGFRPVGIVVGEPTSLRMVTAHKGSVRWRIRTRGVAAHSSDPSRGRSAITAMVRVIDAIESQYIPRLDVEHPLAGRTQCSINLIQGGTQINVIPPTCEIRLDRRTVPGEDPTGVVPAVEAVLDTLRAEMPELAVEQDAVVIDPALAAEASAAFASRVGKVLETLGSPAIPTGAEYGTNAGSYAAGGWSAVVLGPGRIAQAHSAEEYLELEQLQRGVDVYARLMACPPGHWR